MKKIRCIIVGMGGLSMHMVPILLQKVWYETAAVVDIREEALAKAQSRLSLRDNSLFKNLGEALRKVTADVAIINTPSELHYEQTKAALGAGLHVLVAKPITNDYEQAVELVKIAKEQGLRLTVGDFTFYIMVDSLPKPIAMSSALKAKKEHSDAGAFT